MTATYKIALAGSATLLLIVIATLILRSSPTDEPQPLGDDQELALAPDADESSDDPWASDPPADPPRRGVGESTDSGSNASPRIRYDDTLEPLPEPDPVPTLDVGRNPFGEERSIFAPDFEPVTSSDTTLAENDNATDAVLEDDSAMPELVTPEVDTQAPAEANRSMNVDGVDETPTRPAGIALGPTDRVASVPGGEAPAEEEEPAFAPGPPVLRLYTIESGDSLSSIALAVYGSGNRWVEIAQANPTIDPNRLKVGQEIKLPDLSGQGEAAADAPAEDDLPRRGASYTVKSGDSLSTIAQQFYSSASKWELIYQANRRTIGENPGNLKVGMELLIPPPANGAN